MMYQMIIDFRKNGTEFVHIVYREDKEQVLRDVSSMFDKIDDTSDVLRIHLKIVVEQDDTQAFGDRWNFVREKI